MFYLLLHYYVHVVPGIWILTLCVAFFTLSLYEYY